MDHRSGGDKDTEVDLESGLAVNEDYSKKVSTPGSARQGKTFFAMVSGGFVGVHINGEDRPSLYCNKSTGFSSVDMVNVTSNSLAGKDSVDHAEKTPVKEKRKKSSNKKAPKPPRPPRAPSLNAADQKLIREISHLAMLKRARIERMKALKKMKAAKSSSSNSGIFSTVFTIIFCIVILFQGMSSGKSSVASSPGSPVSVVATEFGMISAQYHLNPSASGPNAPGSESHNFIQPVAGSDSPEKQRRDVS